MYLVIRSKQPDVTADDIRAELQEQCESYVEAELPQEYANTIKGDFLAVAYNMMQGQLVVFYHFNSDPRFEVNVVSDAEINEELALRAFRQKRNMFAA